MKTRKDYETMVSRKFTDEPPWVPYFWEMVVDGCADYEEEADTGILLYYFKVNDDDKNMFPELKHPYAVIWEDDEGHVMGYTGEEIKPKQC